MPETNNETSQSMLFDAIPAQLNKNASRYQVSSVLENERADSILELLAEMVNSKTVLISYRANDPNSGLSANKDLKLFNKKNKNVLKSLRWKLNQSLTMKTLLRNLMSIKDLLMMIGYQLLRHI